jgi:hypothetical protein
VAGLLVAVFHNNAQATTFTNDDFTTYNQLGWGDEGNGSPGAVLVENYYDSVYASSSYVMEVGIHGTNGFSLVFTNPTDLVAYLPDPGNPGALDSDLLNPTSSSSGAFGGEVTALKLNIDFSDAGVLPGNLGIPFGDLVLTNFTDQPQLNGLTVRQFSAVLNTLLGGGSYGSYTTADIPNLYTIVSDMNSSFGGGVVQPFATEYLVVVQVPPVMQSVSSSGSTITFTWSTTPGSRYQVEFITDLTQTNWISLGSPIRATNFSWTASETMTNSQGFYRVELLPPQAITFDFITYGRSDWGDFSDEPDAEGLLVGYFDTVYASSDDLFVVGIPGTNGFSLEFSDADYLAAYLPSGGPAGPLDSNLFNPTSTPSGVFGGDVAALKLNIDFSDAGLLGGTGVHFGDLVLTNFGNTQRGMPGLNGLTVREFSAVVNTLLGGGSYGHYTIADLDPITQDLNGSFSGGVPSAFVTEHLLIP